MLVGFIILGYAVYDLIVLGNAGLPNVIMFCMGLALVLWNVKGKSK